MFKDPSHNVIEFGFLPGQKVADLGSGSGFYTAALSRTVGNTGLVIAIDIQPEPLVRLKKAALEEGKKNIEILDGDIEKLGGTKLKDSGLDGAVFSHTFSKLLNKSGAILEAKRIVRPGGKVCLIEWRRKITKANDQELFEDAGLVFERAFEAGEEHYGLIFRKMIQ